MLRSMILAVSLAMAMTDSITAATMFTSTDILTGANPANPEQTWQVSITSTLTDNFNGDFTRQEWRYSVANISYVPNQIPPGVGTLIGSGITLFFVPVFGTTPLGTGPFQSYFQPADWVARFSGFVGDVTRVDPVLWRTGLSSAAILAGSVCRIWILDRWSDRCICDESFGQCRAVERVSWTCRCDFGKYPGAGTCSGAHDPELGCRSDIGG